MGFAMRLLGMDMVAEKLPSEVQDEVIVSGVHHHALQEPAEMLEYLYKLERLTV